MRRKKVKHLFAYGTLMCNDIMAKISGSNLVSIPATLRGYQPRCVKGEYYRALVPEPEGRVEGVVYRDVSRMVWGRLDRFEGDMYVREMVHVEVSNGVILPAETYVGRSDFLDHLDEAEWDFVNFLRSGKQAFRKHYRGYGEL
jgi:gamma-glutamylcyclotransferase (GGCT)/AIG2-like uncharacterized protein YtfP